MQPASITQMPRPTYPGQRSPMALAHSMCRRPFKHCEAAQLPRTFFRTRSRRMQQPASAEPACMPEC
eukprot:9594884-Alexandrium_andersonii.AAC.1